MPHLKSAEKNLRKSQRREKETWEFKEKLEKALKKPVTAKTLPSLFKAIDKAAKKKIFSQNKAARLKSSLSKKIK